MILTQKMIDKLAAWQTAGHKFTVWHMTNTFSGGIEYPMIKDSALLEVGMEITNLWIAWGEFSCGIEVEPENMHLDFEYLILLDEAAYHERQLKDKLERLKKYNVQGVA